MIAITKDERDFIEKAFKVFLPTGTTVYYFGSRVSGQHRQYSDLDIAIKTPQPIQDGTLSNLKATFEGSDLPFRVDLTDYSTLSDEFRGIVDATSEKVSL